MNYVFKIGFVWLVNNFFDFLTELFHNSIFVEKSHAELVSASQKIPKQVRNDPTGYFF